MAVHEGPGPGAARQSGFDSGTSRETRREHFSRKARRGRLYAYTVFTVAVVVCIVVLAATNTGRVRLHWIVGSGTASLVWIVVSAAVLGWLLGLVTSSVLHWRTRAPRSGGPR